VYRELVRDRPFGRIRIWTPPDRPKGAAASPIVVEWAGLVGDPSSYGLLGGTLVEGETRIDAPLDGTAFPDSLARNDRGAFGLPAGYRAGVLAAVPFGLAVSVAAHGMASSSPLTFGELARLLVIFLRHGIPEGDDEVWRTFDEARDEARQAQIADGPIR